MVRTLQAPASDGARMMVALKAARDASNSRLIDAEHIKYLSAIDCPLAKGQLFAEYRGFGVPVSDLSELQTRKGGRHEFMLSEAVRTNGCRDDRDNGVRASGTRGRGYAG